VFENSAEENIEIDKRGRARKMNKQLNERHQYFCSSLVQILLQYLIKNNRRSRYLVRIRKKINACLILIWKYLGI
jgi:hypothetical protein